MASGIISGLMISPFLYKTTKENIDFGMLLGTSLGIIGTFIGIGIGKSLHGETWTGTDIATCIVIGGFLAFVGFTAGIIIIALLLR